MLAQLLSGGLIKGVASIVDQFHTSDEEKAELQLKAKAMVLQHIEQAEESLRIELQARERIMVAEMQSGDNFTKRARPTLVYAGLAMIAWKYCLAPVAVAWLAWTYLPSISRQNFGWPGVAPSQFGRLAAVRSVPACKINLFLISPGTSLLNLSWNRANASILRK